MANKTATHLPELITSDDANNFVLTIDNPVVAATGAYKTFYITIVDGTWSFNTNGDANASESSATWTSSDSGFPITIHGNKLQCRATAGSKSFRINF